MATDKTIRELYEEAEYPVATVDANAYITWANTYAKENYPELFRRDGLRLLARFSDERMMISRLVKNGIGATFRPRQMGYSDLQITFTPLPQTGKEMMLTLTGDKKNNPVDARFGSGMIECAVPALRASVAKVCQNIDLARAGIDTDASMSKAVADCGELLGVIGRLEAFSFLSTGGTPYMTKSDTGKYFREIAAAVDRVLKENAPQWDIQGEGELIMDHKLISHAFLMLIANALEHGDGELKATVNVSDEHLSLSVSNKLREGTEVDTENAVRPFVSIDSEERPNDRAGMGLTIAKLAVRAHHGGMHVDCKENSFSVSLEIPNTKRRWPDRAAVMSADDYLSDRFSIVMTELGRFI